MAIRTRSDYFDGVAVNVKSDELARTSRLVSRLTGYPVQYNKAVVGRNAFAHEAGIHQHGVLADRETYEVIDASQVGQEAAQIVLGKHSGRHAFNDTLEKMGIHVQGDALNAAFVRFKELADKKVEITEADLEAIVAEELGIGMVHRYSVYELEMHGGTATKPSARVVLGHGDGKVEATGSGDGMIDAAIAAISEATGVFGKVGNFQVTSVTGGSDALGAVAITVDSEGRKVTAAASPPTSSRRRPARTSTRSTSSCACASAARCARSPAGRDASTSTFRRIVNLWRNAEHAIEYLRDARLDPAPGRGVRGALRDHAGAGGARPRPRDRRRLRARDGARRPARARPASASISRTRCSIGPASGSPADRSVEIVGHDMDQPLPADLGHFDVVVSSFAIHHLEPERQMALYGEVFERLVPGGLFANVEHVASTTPRRHEEFLVRPREQPGAGRSVQQTGASRHAFVRLEGSDTPTRNVFGSGVNLPLLRVRNLGNAQSGGTGT